MDAKELMEQLKTGTFYYYADSLFIHAKVKNICELSKCLHIGFEGGSVDVAIDGIKPIKRPGNIVEKFNWCYMLQAYDNECIGYIGQIEE